MMRPVDFQASSPSRTQRNVIPRILAGSMRSGMTEVLLPNEVPVTQSIFNSGVQQPQAITTVFTNDTKDVQ